MSKPELTREELARLRAVAEAAVRDRWAWIPVEGSDEDDGLGAFDPPTALRLLDMVERQEEAVREAVDAERDACARIADDMIMATEQGALDHAMAQVIRNCIRARGQR